MPELIDTQEAFGPVIRRLRDAAALALDTESDAFFAYKPRICLLQLSVPGLDVLVDTLAGLDLSELGTLLGEEQREVVLHAAENDVIALHHEYGWRIPGLFDTQVASFVLGLSPYSLAGVLEARFDVKLDKSEQRSDWSRRPLTDKQIRYAADDTHYLLELAAELKQRAADAGRTEEIRSECRRIAQREWTPEPFDPDGFARIGGAKDLDGVGLRILRDLYRMRNDVAEERNIAAFRIVADPVLVSVARHRLRGKRGGPQRFWRRYGSRVEGIVRGAEKQGPLVIERRRRTRGTPTPPEIKQDYERLRRWRSAAAQERGVEPWVVARNELLMRVAAAGCRTSADLSGILEPFRHREYGDAILAVLRRNSENA